MSIILSLCPMPALDIVDIVERFSVSINGAKLIWMWIRHKNPKCYPLSRARWIERYMKGKNISIPTPSIFIILFEQLYHRLHFVQRKNVLWPSSRYLFVWTFNTLTSNIKNNYLQKINQENLKSEHLNEDIDSLTRIKYLHTKLHIAFYVVSPDITYYVP